MGRKKMYCMGGGLILLFGVVWLRLLAGPVVWSFKEKGSPTSEPSFAVFNPFRERHPEIEAEKILSLLKNGECGRVFAGLERRDADMCERESINGLEDWRLSNREDNGGAVRLYYRVKRKPVDAYAGEMWFSLAKGTDQQWKVTAINALY